nr:SusD/RagB family nutrient-binding outer membrane lipoprotein [Thermoflexibacter sp.]
LSTAIPQTPAALEMRHIMSQKYIALYGQIEAWTDLRRYNYNTNIFMGYTLPANLAPENNGKPVQRCLPPSFSEEDWNSAAFRAIGGYDIDYHTKPMWFTTNED